MLLDRVERRRNAIGPTSGRGLEPLGLGPHPEATVRGARASGLPLERRV
jgi:hypothetical protein